MGVVVKKKKEETVVPPVEKAAPQAVTEVEHSKTGSKIVQQYVLPMVSLKPGVPHANVGMRAERTVNLGEYNSVKMGVSIFMPCEAKLEEVNKTYDFCAAWVDEKMLALTSDLDPESKHAD